MKPGHRLKTYSRLHLAISGLWPGLRAELRDIPPDEHQAILETLEAETRRVLRIAVTTLVVLGSYALVLALIRALGGWRVLPSGPVTSPLPGLRDVGALLIFLPTFAFAGAGAGLLWRRHDVRRLRRILRARGHLVCLRCGYLVRDLPRCPECGTPQIGSEPP